MSGGLSYGQVREGLPAVELCLVTSRRNAAGLDAEMVMEHTIGIGQLRSATGAYLRQAAAGDTLHVKRRGLIVARIEAVPPPGAGHPISPSYPVVLDLSHFRSHAGRYFDRVAAGESIVIVHQGVQLARISR
jgi:antitoxin (DNA-binding transcriptional repressor) of toxin-antitoxin stability system